MSKKANSSRTAGREGPLTERETFEEVTLLGWQVYPTTLLDHIKVRKSDGDEIHVHLNHHNPNQDILDWVDAHLDTPVTMVVAPYKWEIKEKSGTKYYFVDMKETA